MKKKTKPTARPLSRREADKWLVLQNFCETYSLTPYMKNSYVLSRFWAWWCQVQLQPHVSIPIPRMFTQRDP